MLSLQGARTALLEQKKYPNLSLSNKEDCTPTYPVVVLSNEAQIIFNKKPAHPKEPIPPQKTNYSSHSSKEDNTIDIVAIIISAILLFCLVIADGNGYLIALLVIVLLSSLLHMMMSVNPNSQRSSVLVENDYQEKYQLYLQQKAEYEQKMKEFNSPGSILSFYAEQIKTWKQNRSVPKMEDCSGDEPKKGYAESFFEEYLEGLFTTMQVYINQRIPLTSSGYYYPDFVLTADDLFIDIEIDEPYVAETKKPIHYLLDGGLSIDHERDQTLASKGYEIIRFAEEQVLLHPNDCIRFIDSFIKSIKKGERIPKIPSGIEVKRWTKDEATEYAKRDFRLSYTSQPPCDDFPGFKD